MYLRRCVMSDEEVIILLEAERKLSYLLRQYQELQPKILAWAKDLLMEERKAWGEMRENSVDVLCQKERKEEAIKRGKARDKRYAPFREYFKNLQQQKFCDYQKQGKKLSANGFVKWFLEHQPIGIEIPYRRSNLTSKLIQLAQANAKEFKRF